MLNGSLMKSPEHIPEYSAAQDTWFEEELEQAKLCSYAIVIFCHYPWFLSYADEPDDPNRTLPRQTRHKWLRKMRDRRVRAIVSGHYHRNAGGMSFVRKLKRDETPKPEETPVSGLGPYSIEPVDDDEAKSIDTESLDDVEEDPDSKPVDSEENLLDKPDETYFGPEMIVTDSVGLSHDSTACQREGLRIFRVYEDRLTHEYFTLDNLPTEVALA